MKKKDVDARHEAGHDGGDGRGDERKIGDLFDFGYD